MRQNTPRGGGEGLTVMPTTRCTCVYGVGGGGGGGGGLGQLSINNNVTLKYIILLQTGLQ